MARTVTVTVPDDVADELHVRAVYLDVYGWVRWLNTGDVVSGSSRWTVQDTADEPGRQASRHQEPESVSPVDKHPAVEATEPAVEKLEPLPTAAELVEAFGSLRRHRRSGPMHTSTRTAAPDSSATAGETDEEKAKRLPTTAELREALSSKRSCF